MRRRLSTQPNLRLNDDITKLLRLLDPESIWVRRLQAALVTGSERPARIAFVGDRDSGASRAITAAFDDPLASNQEISLALASRRLQHTPEAILLKYAEECTVSKDEIGIPLNWLKENHAEIVEIQHQDLPPIQSSIDSIYSSDSTLLFVDPVRLLSPPAITSLLREFGKKPNMFVVLDALEPTLVAHLTSQLESIPLIPISTQLAIDALDSFDASFASTYVKSRLPEVKGKIEKVISDPVNRIAASQFTLDAAIESAFVEAAKMEMALVAAQSEIAAFSREMEQVQEETLKSLGVQDGILPIPADELQSSMSQLVDLLHKLTWYKLAFRMDDIVILIANVMDNTFLHSFENRLIFESGRLSHLTSKMTAKTHAMLSSPSFAASSSATLHSPVLLNQIARAEVEYSISSPTELSSHLSSRRNQITSPGSPAELLSLRAQKLCASWSALSTSSIAIAGYSELVQYTDLVTNVGIGLFGIVFASWRLQRGWEKAKGKFLTDVEKRVTGGLEQDLGVESFLPLTLSQEKMLNTFMTVYYNQLAARRMLDRAMYIPRIAMAGTETKLRQRERERETFLSRLREIAKHQQTDDAIE